MLKRSNMNGRSTTPPQWPDENCDTLYVMKATLTSVFLMLFVGTLLFSEQRYNSRGVRARLADR
jgi:hypothetical protein